MAEPDNDDEVIRDCDNALHLVVQLKDVLGQRSKEFFVHLDDYLENRIHFETFHLMVLKLLSGDSFWAVIVSHNIDKIKILKEQIKALDADGAVDNWCKDALDGIRNEKIQSDEASFFLISSPQTTPDVSVHAVNDGMEPQTSSDGNRNLQTYQRQQELPIVWWSLKFARQAMRTLGPKFTKFAGLLGDIRANRIAHERFKVEMKLLFGENSNLSSLFFIYDIDSEQKQWREQVWVQWLSYLIHITHMLMAVSPHDDEFYRLWIDYLGNSISLETLGKHTEPLLRGHSELWSIFQTYMLNEGMRRQNQHL